MGGVNTSLLAIVAAIVTVAGGFAAIYISRAGIDYMGSRGNPRNRAQAHESLWDVGKGVLLVLGAAAIATWAVTNIRFA